MKKIYFYFQPGCPACSAAEPELTLFSREHRQIPVLRSNIQLADWAFGGWSPKTTPGYVLLIEGKVIKKHEGMMTKVQIVAWLGKELTP
jgi:thiol-disulfide isomerase/thioredoxin